MEDFGLMAKQLYKQYFPEFGPTIIKSCTINFYGDDSYSTASGVSTKVLLSTQPLDVIFTKIKEGTVSDAKIRVGDKKALFPSLSIENNTVVNIDDEIVEASGDVWVILSTLSDPANAGYSLHVRKKPVNA